MEYTINVNRKTYNLPPKTIATMEKLEEAVSVDNNRKMSLRNKFETLHGTIKEFLGDETSAEILGSSDFEKIDMSEITLTINKIIDAYDKPVQDYKNEQTRKMLSNIPMDKIVGLTKSLQTVSNIQMTNNV